MLRYTTSPKHGHLFALKDNPPITCTGMFTSSSTGVWNSSTSTRQLPRLSPHGLSPGVDEADVILVRNPIFVIIDRVRKQLVCLR